MPLDLFNVLKSGYDPNNEESNGRLQADGYVKDDKLSDGDQQTYYNKDKNQLLYNVTGSHKLSDIGNDIYLAAGRIKDTNRYKKADSTLKAAKEKYKDAKTTVTGHSLGGNIASYIGSGDDVVKTVNAGYTLGQRTRGNTDAYHSSGDVVSLLGSGTKRSKTIKTPGLVKSYLTGGIVGGILKAHDIKNIKGKVFI